MTAIMAVANSAFDYFSPMPVQNSIEATTILKVPPTNALQQDAPFEFNVVGSESDRQFLDLSESKFIFVVQIQKADGTAPAAAEEGASCCQNLAHSMFRSIEVYFNDKPVNDHNSHYPIVAYVTDILTWTEDVREKRGPLQGWWGKDEPLKWDQLGIVAATAGNNKGITARHALIGAGQEVDLEMRPRLEVFNTDKLIPPKINVKVRFNPSPSAFVLTRGGTADNAIKLVIKEATWWLPVRKATPSQTLAIYKAVRDPSVGAMRIPVTYTRTITRPLAQNATVGNLDNLIIGPIPNLAIVVFARSASLAGTYGTNALEFLHLNITNIQMYAGGHGFPSIAYRPVLDPTKNLKYKREFGDLLQNIKKHKTQDALDLSLLDWYGGTCIWLFDLTPDGNSALSHNPQGTGIVSLDVSFGTALPTATTCIVITQQDGWLEIDQNAEVRTSWGS